MARQLAYICLRQAWIILASPHVDRRIYLFEIFELGFVLLAYDATAPVKRPKLSQSLFILLLLVRCVLNILNHLWFMEADVTILLLLNATTRHKIGRSPSLYGLSSFSSLRDRLNHEVSRLWSISNLVQGNRQCAVWIVLLSLLYRGTRFFVVLDGIVLTIKLLLNGVFLELLIHLWYLLEFLGLLKVDARVGYQCIFRISFITYLRYPLPVLLTDLGLLKRSSFTYGPNMLMNRRHLLFLAVTQQKFGARRLRVVCLRIRR